MKTEVTPKPTAPTSYDFGGELEQIDPNAWTPKPPTNDPKPEPQAVREIAQRSGFTSRQPAKAAPKAEPVGQINIRAKQSVIDDFHALGQAQEPKWPSGYVLERALAALKRELAG